MMEEKFMSINVFEEMRKGAAYDIRQEDYV